MKTVQAWFVRSWVTRRELFMGAFGIFGASLVFGGVCFFLINLLHLPLHDQIVSRQRTVRGLISTPAPLRLLWIFFQTLGEEFGFRFCPLYIVLTARPPAQFGVRPTVFVLIIGSLIFGVLHGGWLYIFYQGIGGLGLSVVFLKSGGWQGRWLQPFLIVWAFHFVHNVILFMF